MAGVEGRVQAELERLDAVDTVDGQIALVLARKLDSPRNEMAVSGNAEKLRTVMAALIEARPTEVDTVGKAKDAIVHLIHRAG